MQATKNGCPTVMVGAAVGDMVFLRFFCFLSCCWQRFFLSPDYSRLVEEKVGGDLGLGGDGENCPAVALEDLQPVVDVFRVTHARKGDAGVGAKKGRRRRFRPPVPRRNSRDHRNGCPPKVKPLEIT